nr:type I-E CRISPR-associated protein Cse1/CasA [Phytoactinopolyspora halophila]
MLAHRDGTDILIPRSCRGGTLSYRLTEQPWVPVVDCDGHALELGLRDVLRRAHQLRWVDAEAPPVTAALHRLLIAVLHRVVEGPRNRHEWRRLWSAESLPEDRIDAYFDDHARAFDLFDDERPFFQCPALADLQARSAAQLVHFRAVGNNATLFDQTTAGERLVLSAAEAARWLVTVQAYDPGGLKTPFTKVKQSQRAPCNNFGTVVVEGDTLKETLLLNLVLHEPDANEPKHTSSADRPSWEAEPPSPEPEKRVTKGWLDVLTWQSRRVLLHRTSDEDGATVDGAVITPGDAMEEQLHWVEKMAAFHQPERRSRRSSDEQRQWQPIQLHRLRGIWRHAREMLIPEDDFGHIRPHVLNHVADRLADGFLPTNEVFTIRVFGQQLDDSGGGSVQTWLQEQLPAPAALLRAEKVYSDSEHAAVETDSWANGALIGICVELADDVGQAIKKLVDRWRESLSAQHSAREKRNAPYNVGLEQDYWPRLAPEFDKFLSNLGYAALNASSREPLVLEWKDTVRNVASVAVDRWAVAVQQRRVRQLDAVAKHYEWFRGRLHGLCDDFDDKMKSILPYEGV